MSSNDQWDWKRTKVQEEWSVQWSLQGRYYIFHHLPCDEGCAVVFDPNPEQEILSKGKRYKCSSCGEPVPSDLGRVGKWLVVAKKMRG